MTRPRDSSAWVPLCTSRSNFSSGWAHHGVDVTDSGFVVTFDAETDDVIVVARDGRTSRRWASGLVEGHGISVSRDDHGRDCVWIADSAGKMRQRWNGHYEYDAPKRHGTVERFSIDGNPLGSLEMPPLSLYDSERYQPTAVAPPDPEMDQQSIWVADGYGAGLVHRFSTNGTYVSTIDHPFGCPHDVSVLSVGGQRELFVADRESAEVHVFNLDGHYRRSFGSGALERPAGIASVRDKIVVADMHLGIVVMDTDGTPQRVIGHDMGAVKRPGWPNALDAAGNAIKPNLSPEMFNSPHSIAVDGLDVIVTEWLIGGRVLRVHLTDLLG